MKYVLVLLIAACAGNAQKKPQLKPPVFEMLDTTARRESGRILLDGRLRNGGERPARGVRVFFDFLDGDRKVIATKSGEISPDPVDPEAEAEFHAQLEEPARVTHVQLRFEDKDGRDIKGLKAGPFAIE